MKHHEHVICFVCKDDDVIMPDRQIAELATKAKAP